MFSDFSEKRLATTKGLRELASIAGSENFVDETIELIEKEEAFLLDSDDGFVILKGRPFGKSWSIVIWAAWSKSGNAITNYHDQLIKIGNDLGASHLEFWTTRKAFQRIAPKLNYKLIDSINSEDHWRKCLWAAAEVAA